MLRDGRPATLSALGQVPGVGAKKLEAYGTDFLAVIRSDHGPLPAYLEQAAVLLPALQAVSGRDCPAGLRGAAVGQWVREAQVRVCQAILPQLESAGK